MALLTDLLTQAMIDNCLVDLEGWGGISVTPAQLQTLIGDQPAFIATLLAFYKDDLVGLGLDTQDRDDLFNIVGKKLTGMEWPRNRDSHGEEFRAALRAAVRHGDIVAFDNAA